MNMYNISEKFKALWLKAEQYAEENDGEISEVLSDELTNAEADLQECIQNALLMAKEKTVLVAGIKAEIKRLQELTKKEELATSSLIKFSCDNGMQPVKTPEYTLKCTNSKFVNITGDIPAEYIRETVKKEPDKAAIKKAIQAGKEVDGAELSERESWKVS